MTGASGLLQCDLNDLWCAVSRTAVNGCRIGVEPYEARIADSEDTAQHDRTAEFYGFSDGDARFASSSPTNEIFTLTLYLLCGSIQWWEGGVIGFYRRPVYISCVCLGVGGLIIKYLARDECLTLVHTNRFNSQQQLKEIWYEVAIVFCNCCETARVRY